MTWVNGHATTSVDVTDRGLQYGDGLFETVTCVDGEPRWLAAHLARLRLGCERLRIPFRDYDLLVDEIGHAAGAQSRAIVKIIVTRGNSAARGYAFAGDETPTRIVSRHEWPSEPADARTRGIAVVTARRTMPADPTLAGIKHLNRLDNVLAAREATERGVDEILRFDEGGRLICGSMTNVFLVRGESLLTPALDRAGVCGVMRDRVLRLAEEGGRIAQVKDVDGPDLRAAEGVFLTNVRVGIWPVQRIDDRELQVPALVRQLQEQLDRHA